MTRQQARPLCLANFPNLGNPASSRLPPGDIVDEGDDVQAAAAVDAHQQIDFLDFLNHPGPVGLAAAVGQWPVNADWPGRFVTILDEPYRFASGWRSSRSSGT